VARKERYLVGLDVGTSKVTAVVGEMLGGEALDIVGLGVAESRGIKRGVVVNIDLKDFFPSIVGSSTKTSTRGARGAGGRR
jgi:hypothetical protein